MKSQPKLGTIFQVNFNNMQHTTKLELSKKKKNIDNSGSTSDDFPPLVGVVGRDVAALCVVTKGGGFLPENDIVVLVGVAVVVVRKAGNFPADADAGVDVLKNETVGLVVAVAVVVTAAEFPLAKLLIMSLNLQSMPYSPFLFSLAIT